MASLETLFIEVDGSTAKASGGINGLVGSLRSLARGVGTVVPSLKAMNSELQKLSRFSNLKLPNIMSTGGHAATASASAATKAVKANLENFKATAAVLKEFKNVNPAQWQSWRYGPRPLPTSTSWTSQNEGIENRPHPYEAVDHRVKLNSSITESASSTNAMVDGLQHVEPAFTGTAQAAESATTAVEGTAQAMQTVASTTTGAGQAIASSSANSADFARSLIESTSNIDLLRMKLDAMTSAYYQAAGAGKLNSKQLAEQAMNIRKVTDELRRMEEEQNRASTTTAKSTASAHKFGSSIARMAKSLLIRTALRALMRAFSDAWTAAYNYSHAMGGQFAQNVDKLRGAVAGTAINLVTAFAPALNAIVPIVNVVAGAIQYLCNLIKQLFSLLGMSSEFFGVSAESINNYSKAAGGGGSSTKGMLAAFDELNVIQSQGGGGGGGGAGAKGMTFVSDIVSDEMARLQMIVGESMIGIGLLLACTGHVPLGVAMIAIGAAAIVKTVVNDWGGLSQQVKDEIGNIMAIAAGAFIALGLILACFGHVGLGVGLIAAGVANLVGLAAISGSISEEVRKTLANITKIAGASMLALGVILLCFGQIPLGIGLLIAGAGSLAASLALDTGSTAIFEIIGNFLGAVVSMFTDAWNEVTKVIRNAWNAVSLWFSSAADKIKGAWKGATNWLREIWVVLEATISNAWDTVSQWFKSAVSAVTRAWSSAVTWLSGVWNTVESAISTAWDCVSEWFKPALSAIGRAWSTAVSWLENAWDNISSAISWAWTAFTSWIGDIMSPLKRAWDAATQWLYKIWEGISCVIETAWGKVEQWWGDISSSFSTAWSGVEAFFQPLADIVSEIAGWIDSILKNNVINFTINIARNITETITTVKKMTTPGTTENNVTTTNKEVLRDSGWLGGLMAGALDVLGFANGGYDIPKGEIFVAQEAGAELVGEINGKTSVANQQQIMEGISMGVERANAEQNALLRQQNDLLRGILEKETVFRFGASSAFGRVAQQSLDMYANAVGGR